ncbi:MAG: CRISPR-associated endonuclease Cas2 [Bryobacterales bacterium]|nr:CRISPR-associated endonuclease Cas2 [Bryobacterales bacterium]
MWLFALFDLPVETKEQRREYAQFRKSLLSAGFTMLQYSVYAKHMASEEAAEHLRAKVHAALPPQGQVRLLTVTDHQFGKMEVYVGKRRRPVEQAPLQISLF